MADARDIQIMSAQQNPSILSALSGAPTQSSQLQAPNMPSDPSAAYQQTQQMSADMASKLYGGGPSKQIAGDIDSMTKALFDYDQQLEKNMSPFPSLPFYTENTADKYRAGAGYASQAGSNISRGQSAVSSLDQAYQNAIGNVMSKMFDYFQLQEQRRAKEEDRKEEQENRLIQLLSASGGGAYTDPTSGRTFNIQGKEPRLRQTQIVEIAGRQKVIDTQTGEVIEDLGPSTTATPLFGSQGTQTPSEPKPSSRPSLRPGGMAPLAPSGTSGGSAQMRRPSLDNFWRQ